MDSLLRIQVRKAILEEGLSLQQLVARFDSPDDAWEIRRIYADVKREQAQTRVDEATELRPYTPSAVISKKGIEAMNAGWMRPINLEFSPLKQTKPLFAKASRTVLVCADIHAPDEDPDAMDVMYQVGRATGIDELIIDGDLYNVSSLSKYTPTPDQHLRWVDERAEAIRVPVQIRQNFPNIPIRFLPGNHDMRPFKWINANALPLQNILTLSQWLGLDDEKLGFEVVEGGRIELANGKLIVKHGTSVSQNAGQSVQREINKSGVSTIMGHVHRRALIEVTKANEVLTGVELGCLCKLRPDYGNIEDVVNWQQGFAIVTEYDDDDFDVEMVRITNGRATFRGKRFQSRVTIKEEVR
jgi:predicted phosphodiesterase